MNDPRPASAVDDHVLPVSEEQIEIGRRVVESGAVRIRKQVDSVPVAIDDVETKEEVSVQRVPVGRVVDAPLGVRQEGDVTIVPVLEERLVKQWVLVEEIHLTRSRREVPVQHEVSVRRESVVVERRDAETGAWRPDNGKVDDEA